MRPAIAAVLVLAAGAAAQDLAVARAAAKIDTAIPWISDGFYPTDPGQPVARLPKTDVDRGRLLDQALERAAAEKKPVLWYIPRIEGGHMVRPEILDGYVRVLIFTDPAVARLVNERFVPLRMAVDGPTSKRTGIVKLDWVEPAIAILSSDGAIRHRLDRIRTFDPEAVRRMLLRALGTAAQAAEEPAETRAASDEGTRAAALTARARTALRGGDVVLAGTLAADAAGVADNPRRAESLWLLGIARALTRDEAGAEETFRELVAGHVDDPAGWPYAAQAASNLLRARDSTPLGPVFHAFLDPVAPPEPASAESRPTTAWPRPPGDVSGAARRAVAFLLRHQRSSGGFEDARYAFCDSPRILPNVWVAATAVALGGLNDWREVDPAAVDAAIARGEEYLFDESRMARGHNEECYADAFKIAYLARRVPRLAAGEAVRARKLMIDAARRLAGQQTESGFWAHEYPNPFAAAAALVALRTASDHGAAIPPSTFEGGVKALRSTRGPGGTFAYGAGRAPRRESDEAFKNAMARMPVCESALLLAGAGGGDPSSLETALDNFWKHLPRLERIRTCDFHADGELGGFFFWHAMFLTSEAIKSLPPEKQAAHHRRMLEHVMSIPEIDGSFVDSHELGKSYGTGMALMALRNSVPRTP
jgi:hypothetical protein